MVYVLSNFLFAQPKIKPEMVVNYSREESTNLINSEITINMATTQKYGGKCYFLYIGNYEFYICYKTSHNNVSLLAFRDTIHFLKRLRLKKA